MVSVPSLRAIDSRLSAPGPEVALLRQVSFFGPLPFATVEHLASVLRPAAYEPGDVIIREGDPGERFYLIAAGRASGGRRLSEMGAGDSFGEIALLRRIPRTAAVTAISRLHARILDREEFLAAVTGSADAVISSRLQEASPLTMPSLLHSSTELGPGRLPGTLPDLMR